MKQKHRKTFFAAALVASLTLAVPAAWADPPKALVYKSPTCGCCSKWIDHLEKNGFEVESKDVHDVRPIKQANGVPPGLSSCHTAMVGGYFIEGHVPAEDVKRLLQERPEIAGLTVPGMPTGSPGMEGPHPERYRVFAVGRDGKLSTFATHGP